MIKSTPFFKALLVLLSCLAMQAQAQKLQDLKAYDTMNYVYKLDKAQTDFIIHQSNIPDTSSLFKNVWKRYPRSLFKEDTLLEGNYILATIDREWVTYTYINRSNLNVRTKVIDETVIVFLSDKKSGQIIEKAHVEIDGQTLAFDEGYGGYSFNRNKINPDKLRKNKVYLTFSYQDNYSCLLYSYSQGFRQPQVSSNPYNGGFSEGYFITDKPVYKPLDTLQLKAFLTEPKHGRPIRKKAWLSISEPMQNFSLIKKIKPKSPGAFVYAWQIPDSLKIDRNLNLSFYYKKRQFSLYKNHQVYLEDYRLTANTYNLSMGSSEFYAGDDIRFQLNATDANGFPLQGTLVHYKLSIQNITDFSKDSLQLSVARKANWYEKDTVFPFENTMQLTIPSSILPPVNAYYTLEVTFTDPNSFERKVLNQNFIKRTSEEKVIFSQNEDSLTVRCLYNLRDTNRTFTLICFSNADTLYKKKIVTPYHCQLSPFATSMLLIDKDSAITPLNILFNKLSITHVEGKRQHDSVKIDFRFPFEESVYYEILKNGKRISSGKKKRLQFAIADESREAYTLRFTHNILGQIDQNFYELTFIPQLHAISIQSDIPNTAFPGQTIPVTITALDYKNKPLRRINIAAYAVNKQFEDRIHTPEFTIPESYRDKLKSQQSSSLDYVSLSAIRPSNRHHLSSKHFTNFDLRKNEYYALRYPETAYALIKKSIQSAVPEVAVTITHKDQLLRPKYILIDKQPVYITDLQADVYSFPLSAGEHEITFRYFDKKIIIPKLQFDAHTKYTLGINFDSLKKSSTALQIIDSMTVAQPDKDEKDLLYGSLLLIQSMSGDTVKVFQPEKSLRYEYNAYHRPQQLNVDGEIFSAIGPLKQNQLARLKVADKEFDLTVNSTMSHYYDFAGRQFTTRSIGSVKGVIFNFQESACQDYMLLALSHPDTLVPGPEKAPVTVNPNAQNLAKEPDELNFSQNYRIASGPAMFNMVIKNSNKQHFVKAMWIINRKKPDDAEFIPDVYRGTLYRYNKYADSGKHDIYLLMNRNEFICLPDIDFHHQDEFYLDPVLLSRESISNEKLSLPLKIYNDLTRVPLLPFYLSPDLLPASFEIKQDDSRHNPYLFGTITDPSFSPVIGALVLVEVNGVYQQGGITNQNGDYEILNLPQGTYQVKVYHPEFAIQHFEASFLQNGHTYALNTHLNPLDTKRPIFETVHTDFRVAVFGEHKQANTMRIQAYDKDKRASLRGAMVKLFSEGKLISEQLADADGNVEWGIPLSAQEEYSLEWSKEGYITVQLRGIHFLQDMYFLIQAFLPPVNKQLAITRKEYEVNLAAYVSKENFKQRSASIRYEAISTKTYSEISGKVRTESNKGLNHISITLVQHKVVKANTKSNAQGEFVFKNVAAGNYEIRFTCLGYETGYVGDINLTGNNRALIDISLQKRESVALETSITVQTAPEYKIADESLNAYRSNTYSSYASPNASAPMYNTVGSATNSYNSEALSESIVYTMDGISISSASDNLEFAPAAPRPYVGDEMIEQVNQSQNAPTVRNRFSDVGYWKPNFVTNKKGKVSFSITLPDNITTWKSTLLAMGKHRMHGIDSIETRVFKPLQTQSIVPPFLYSNDYVFGRAKFSNLTEGKKEIHVHIRLNDSTLLQKDISVKGEEIDSVKIVAGDKDTLYWEAGLTYGDKYKDAEARKIKVYSPALTTYQNQQLQMDADSTYSLSFAKDVQGYLIFNNTLYEKIRNEIDQLNQYEYACTEQCASKLRALLVKVRINRALNIDEPLTKSIYALINRLANYQNNDGSWGWWKRDVSNWRMTLYAMDVLFLANQSGYVNSNWSSAQYLVKANYHSMSNSDKLYALSLLLRSGASEEFMITDFRNMKHEELRSTDQMYYVKIQALLGDTVQNADLYALYLQLSKQSAEPYCDNFFYDPRASIFTAYQLFANTHIGNQWVEMFRDKLRNGQLEQNANTYAKACMIEALSSTTQNTGGKTIQAEVKVNDTLRINQFPYRLPIIGMKYTFTHTGGDVFVQSAEKKVTYKPTSNDTVYRVQTRFMQKNQTSDKLKAGIPCEMVVSLDAFRTHEQVMLEIPIPAGLRVVDKPQFAGAVVEYHAHKIVVFFTKLTAGQQSFTFHMQPFFTGRFTVPAAKCSLMYYPFVSGNNESKTLTIE